MYMTFAAVSVCSVKNHPKCEFWWSFEWNVLFVCLVFDWSGSSNVLVYILFLQVSHSVQVPGLLTPPKVLLLCCSWGACVPRRSQRLCQLEFWLLAGTTMLDRLWARGQTKCNTPLMLATSVFGRILRRPCYVMAQPKSRLDIPWPNDAECMGHVWYHFSCWYPLLFYVESPAGGVGG